MRAIQALLSIEIEVSWEIALNAAEACPEQVRRALTLTAKLVVYAAKSAGSALAGLGIPVLGVRAG